MVVSPPLHAPFMCGLIGLCAHVPKNPNAHAPMEFLLF